MVFPNQEQRQGTLIRGKKKTKIKIKARQDYQYEIYKKKWQIIPSGEESDIMISLDRTITDAKFQLTNESKESYTYRFIPHLSFLDPTFTRKFVATLTINKKTLLPKNIIAQDSSRNILWQLEFFNYNKVKRIDFPFDPTTRIILTSEKKLSKTETNSILEILKKRLEIAGESFRCFSKVKDNATLFFIELQLVQQDLDVKSIKYLLTSPGRIEVSPINDSITLLDNTDISEFKIKSDEPYPMIELSFTQSGLHKIDEHLNLSNGQASFRLFLDSTIIGSFSIDKTDFSDRIIFLSLVSTNEIMKIKAIFQGGMLTTELVLFDIESIK